jgi:hypothetical protein
MPQKHKVKHSRQEWKRKAVHRGVEARELRKTVNRRDQQLQWRDEEIKTKEQKIAEQLKIMGDLFDELNEMRRQHGIEPFGVSKKKR